MSVPWDETISGLREGDAAAFAMVYDRYAGPIHNYAYRLLGNRAQADDATQETFLRAWRKRGQLRDETRLDSWLFAIASNLCIDTLRRRKLLSWLPLHAHEDVPDVAPEPAVAEHDLVRRVLGTLPEKYALALVLRHAEGFTCREIAEMLGLSVDNVWQRLSRGREMFTVAYGRLAKGGRL